MTKRTINIHLSYEGTRFYGWQKQPQVPSIQGELEKALKILYKKKVICQGVGRTDGGAHALDYSAHFQTSNVSLPLERLPLALNRHLPSDIRVRSAREMEHDFHARFSAHAREYIYHIQAFSLESPFWSPYTYYYPHEIRIERIREILPLFKGEHDFQSFCYGYGDQTLNYRRTIYYLRLSVIKGHLVFTIKGSAFLQGMIRSIISVCLNYQRGMISREQVERALSGQEEINPKFRAPVPARGLFFKRAYYGESKVRKSKDKKNTIH